MSALPSPDPVSPYILLGMTATTGIVDAVSLLALGHVFTATGNVLFLSFALAGAQGFSIPRSSMALIAFLLGAAAGGRLATQMTSGPLHYWTSGAFCIDGFLLMGAALVSLASRSPADEGSIPLLNEQLFQRLGALLSFGALSRRAIVLIEPAHNSHTRPADLRSTWSSR